PIWSRPRWRQQRPSPVALSMCGNGNNPRHKKRPIGSRSVEALSHELTQTRCQHGQLTQRQQGYSSTPGSYPGQNPTPKPRKRPWEPPPGASVIPGTINVASIANGANVDRSFMSGPLPLIVCSPTRAAIGFELDRSGARALQLLSRGVALGQSCRDQSRKAAKTRLISAPTGTVSGVPRCLRWRGVL